jgi:hypothetical protein
MAKLPRSPISEGVTNQYRPVREARASGADPVGQAMEQAGNAGFEIASRMADAKIAVEGAKAETALQSRLDAEKRLLETATDIEPEELEARFRERAAAIVSEEAGRMSSPAMKRAFGQISGQKVESYSIQMRDVTRRKQVARIDSDLLSLADSFQKTTEDANSYFKDPKTNEPSVAESALANAMSAIDRSAGILDEDVVKERKLKLQAAYDVGLSNMHVKNVDTRLEAGNFAAAESYFRDNSKEISKAEQDKVEEVIRVKTREGVAVRDADEIRAAHPGDLTAQLEKARQIEDVAVRKSVTDHIIAENARDVTATNAKQDAVRMAGMEPILNGGGMGSIPGDVLRDADADTVAYWQNLVDSRRERSARMATLSAEQKAALKAYETNVVGAINAVKDSDPDLYNRGPRAWMAEDPALYAQFVALDGDAKAAIERGIESSRTGGGKVSAADGIYSQLVAGSTTFGVDLTAMKTENPDRYNQVIGALRNAADQEARALGDGALTVVRRKEIFGTVLSTVYKNEGEMAGFRPFGSPVGPLALAPELNASTEERRRALDIAALLPRDYRAARAKLLDKGNANPSEMEVATEALSMRAKQDAKEAPPTFTQGDR